MSNQNFEGFTPYDSNIPPNLPPTQEEEGVGPLGPVVESAMGLRGDVCVAVGSAGDSGFSVVQEFGRGGSERRRGLVTSWTA